MDISALRLGCQQTRRATLASSLLLAARPAWAEHATAKRLAQDGVENSQSPLVQSALMCCELLPAAPELCRS